MNHDEKRTIKPIEGQTKISQLLKIWPKDAVAVQSWLSEQGVSRQLALKYTVGNWLTKIGHGAYIKAGDTAHWVGGVYALKNQLEFKVHVAGLTALELQGYSHFIPMQENHMKWLSKHKSDKRFLPVWFREYFKKDNITCVEQGLFERQWNKGLTAYTFGDCTIMIASPERAILEFLHFDSHGDDIAHGLLLMEGLISLCPLTLQALLESCQSVKVKRLFLAIAEQVNYPWLGRLNVKKIDLGRGKRVIGSGGYYYPKYQLSLPVHLKEVNPNHDE